MKSRSDEENYAERIGRNMWRMAKRRAQGALLLGRPWRRPLASNAVISLSHRKSCGVKVLRMRPRGPVIFRISPRTGRRA